MNELASTTAGLSFAHLKEIENLTGLIAAREQHAQRELNDVREAARLVIESHRQASRGFPDKRKRVGFGSND